MTRARARDLVGAAEGTELVVVDWITADARALLTAAGWSWLDLRGHLHLRGGGLLIDTAVDAVASPTARRVQSPLRGKAGLGVAYWLCAHPDQALSSTGHSTEGHLCDLPPSDDADRRGGRRADGRDARVLSTYRVGSDDLMSVLTVTATASRKSPRTSGDFVILSGILHPV